MNHVNVHAGLDIRQTSSRRFAIIGAGAAGLCAAKHLQESGFTDITIFEIGTQIGGMWCYRNDNRRSAAYKTLHINTARNVTNFSDLEFRDDVQMFPSHQDMHEYLVSYANHFDLVKYIKFSSRVTGVRPAMGHRPEKPKWEVQLESGGADIFDRVIVASGHLSEPLHVGEFRNNFSGEYVHSHDYREPDRFLGKRICVVGAGNSACDIAADVCVLSDKTVMVARSGVMIAPKLIFGRPFTDTTMVLYKHWFPDRLRRWIISSLVYLFHGRMTDLGFKPLVKRAHPTTNAVLVQHIAYQRVLVKVGIERINGKRIHFSDGTSDEFDVLIAATGYLIDLPFLSPSIVPIVNNSIDLYKRILPPDQYGLYFVGFLNSTAHALNRLFEYQSRWICALETGDIVRPSADEMRRDIAAKHDYIHKHFKESPRHTIEEESLLYMRELDRQMPRRKRKARVAA